MRESSVGRETLMTSDFETKEIKETIEALRESLEKLLKDVVPLFESGRFTSILSEGSSARIPSNIVYAVLKKIAIAKGLNPPHLLYSEFFSFIRDRDNDTRQRLSRKFREDAGKRALVVTDYVVTGDHLRSLGEELKSFDISYDVATLAMGTNPSWRDYEGDDKDGDAKNSLEEYGMPRDSRLFGPYMSFGLNTDFIYGKPHMSGVQYYRSYKKSLEERRTKMVDVSLGEYRRSLMAILENDLQLDSIGIDDDDWESVETRSGLPYSGWLKELKEIENSKDKREAENRFSALIQEIDKERNTFNLPGWYFPLQSYEEWKASHESDNQKSIQNAEDELIGLQTKINLARKLSGELASKLSKKFIG